MSFTEPKRFRALPTLRIRFFVLSMDHNGHVIWPTNFGVETYRKAVTEGPDAEMQRSAGSSEQI